MANFQDQSGNYLATMKVRMGALTTVALWGGGPAGEALDVACDSLLRVLISEITVRNRRSNTRYFTLLPVLPGMFTVRALFKGRDYAQPLTVTVLLQVPHLSYREFYHGTTLDAARALIDMELTPQSVAEARLLDDSEYTDFGKGFYVHPPENRKLAIDWAKNHANRNKTTWGVACFPLSDSELDNMPGQRLRFANKRNHRPNNSPKLFGNRPANWIEFVEFNRHVRIEIKRPKDNDWTGDFAHMRGPIWVQQDSKLPGKLPPFDENIHQINLGVLGLAMLNSKEARARRYVIHEGNQ